MVPTWVRLVPAALGLVAIATSVAPASPVVFPNLLLATPAEEAAFLELVDLSSSQLFGLEDTSRVDLSHRYSLEDTDCLAMVQMLMNGGSSVQTTVIDLSGNMGITNVCAQAFATALAAGALPSLTELYVVDTSIDTQGVSYLTPFNERGAPYAGLTVLQ